MTDNEASDEPTPTPPADALGPEPSPLDTPPIADVEPPLDEAAADHDIVDEDPVDQNTADQDPADEDTTDEDTTDQDPVDQDPVDEDPIVQDPADEPGAAEPDDVGWATPPPLDDPPPPLPPVRRLRRAGASSGPGVAAGIARYFGIETGIVKAAFVVTTFFGGLGIFAYIAAWAFIPKDGHPDPRPIVLNGNVAAIVIGTLALVGAVSVGFGAGGATGNLLVPVLLIGLGFYLLDQRSTAQVISDTPRPPRTRPSWIPPLTTTPYAATPHTATPYTAGPHTAGPYTATPYAATPAGGNPAWGSILTEPAETVTPAPPRPPVAAVTMAIMAATVGVLIGLDQFTGVDVSVPQMFGAALSIIVVGIIVSMFVGRSIGLWFAGFVALIGLAISPVAVAVSVSGVGSHTHTVLDESELLPTYELGVGELIVDLRDTEFTEDATTSIDLKAGSIVVYVPAETALDLQARTRGGEIAVPSAAGSRANDRWCEPNGRASITSGRNAQVNRVFEAREGGPVLTIDADVRFGEIEIICS